MNTLLLILMSISIPAILIINLISSRVYKKLFSLGQIVRDKQVNFINMVSIGFVSLTSFGVSNKIFKLFRDTLTNEVDLQLKEWRFNAWKNNFEWFFGNGIAAIALWGSWFYALQGSLSLGEAIAAIMYFNMILSPVVSISGSIRLIATATISAKRLLDPIEFSTFEYENDKFKGSHYNAINKYFMRLKNVSYKYPFGSKLILNNITLDLSCNSFIGIHGPSGIGKTTLGKLIAGHLKPTQGNIYPEFNGNSKGNILYVPETTYIFPGSIKDNIVFFSDVDNLERLNKCVDKAALYEVINNLPNRIETKLGDNQIVLSQGQKQRLLIARALYQTMMYDVFIFDDPVNNIESSLSDIIINNLRRLVRDENKTILILSTRKECMKFCDETFLMTNGSIDYDA